MTIIFFTKIPKSPQFFDIFGHLFAFPKMFPKTHFNLQHNCKVEIILLLNMIIFIHLRQNAFLETFGNKKNALRISYFYTLITHIYSQQNSKIFSVTNH